MNYIINETLDLKKIEESGQCFRWKALENDKYLLITKNKYTVVKQSGNHLLFSCDQKDIPLWEHYFDLQTDYEAIIDQFPKEDRWLQQAVRHQTGIRILNQDPWEMVITFIVSQRKSIPTIKTCIEKICELADQPIGTIDDKKIFRFPSPEELWKMRDQLERCSLGYRLKYVISAAEAMRSASIEELELLPDSALEQKLMEIHGVGKKVASCIMLFGFHRMNAFPVDVWINRALEHHYPEGFRHERYAPWAGLVQQFLFMEERRSAKESKYAENPS